MNTNEELRQQMWELAYGLLTPEETASLHARIKSDPAAARLYAEVRLQADLVADAAKVDDPSFAVTAQGEPARVMPARRTATSNVAPSKSPSRGMNWLAGVAGTALAAMLCVVLFRPTASDDPSADEFIATVVEAPAQLQAGITQQVSVFTCAPDETGASAEVDFRLVDAAGKQRLRKTLRTDENGHAKVELPGDVIEPGVRLEATAKSESSAANVAASSTADQPVSLAAEVIPEPVERYVLLDKPAYERGDTVRYAVRDVKRFSKQPAGEGSESLVRQKDVLQQASGDVDLQTAQASPGLVVSSLRLEGVPLADTERWSDRNQDFDQGSTKSDWFFFDQLKDELPQLAKQQAEADASKLAGNPLAANDRFDQKFGERDLARSRGLRMSAADAAPAEGGAAPAGVKATPGYGTGPSADFSKEALMGQLAAKQELNFLVVGSGQPIEVPLPESRSADLLVTAKCGDRLVAQETVTWQAEESQSDKLSKSLDSDEAAKSAQQPTVRLNPVPEADGEILVKVFNRSQQPPQLIASHRYFREPQQRLEIELKNLKDRYQPGQQVELQIQVLDEGARPVDATLAVRVWNERLVQAAKAPVADLASTVLSTPPSAEPDPNSWAMQSYQFGNLARGGQANAGDRSASGLGEGTALRGSKFADGSGPSVDFDALNADEPFVGDPSWRRLEASNLTTVRAAYESAVSDARQAAAERKVTIARLLMIGGLAVLGLLGMQALLRVSPKASVWLPAVAVAAASLLVGMVWWAPSFERGEVVQTAAVPEGKPEAEPAATSPASGEGIETFGASEGSGGRFGGTESLGKELRQSDSPQTSDSSSATENSTIEEIEERLKEKNENDALAYRAPEGDAASSTRSAHARIAPAPKAAPAEVAAGAPADDAPSAFEESVGRKGREPTNGPQAMGRLELAESRENEAATRPKADVRLKSMERTTGEAAGKRLADSEPPDGASVLRDQQQFGAPPAAAATAGAAPAPPAADSIAASGGRGGAAAPPAPSAMRMARSQLQPTEPGASDDPVADQPRPSSAGVAGADDSAKDEEADRQLAKKNASESQRRAVRGSAEREAKSQAESSAPSALLFEPALATDAKGKATIHFTLPEVDCEYRVLIDAIGHGRVGSLQQVIVGQSGTAETTEAVEASAR